MMPENVSKLSLIKNIKQNYCVNSLKLVLFWCKEVIHFKRKVTGKRFLSTFEGFIILKLDTEIY